MKILSGYDEKSKTDYRAKVAEEIDQLRRRADLLREMLLGVTEGETIGQADVFEVPPFYMSVDSLQDLAASIRGAGPKLQKMVEDEAEDQEAVAKLLELKEIIEADLEKYDRLRKGDFQGAQHVVVKPMYPLVSNAVNYSNITPTKKSTNGAPTSLIDFDGDLGGSTISGSSKQNYDTGNLLDDLAGLSFQSNLIPFGQGGSISLGHDTSTLSPYQC